MYFMGSESGVCSREIDYGTFDSRENFVAAVVDRLNGHEDIKTISLIVPKDLVMERGLECLLL